MEIETAQDLWDLAGRRVKAGGAEMDPAVTFIRLGFKPYAWRDFSKRFVIASAQHDEIPQDPEIMDVAIGAFLIGAHIMGQAILDREKE